MVIFWNFIRKFSWIRTSTLEAMLHYQLQIICNFFSLKKSNIIDNFPIINHSNKSFIISILYSSIVSKFNPKNKPNKHNPKATTALMLINYFLKIVNNSYNKPTNKRYQLIIFITNYCTHLIHSSHKLHFLIANFQFFYSFYFYFLSHLSLSDNLFFKIQELRLNHYYKWWFLKKYTVNSHAQNTLHY